jgi:precorrin-2 dehydrogenase/sirohydrochlorin ferrochelatase
MMGYYPVAMDLTGARCLLVGGGEIALRRARSLVEAGACVTIIAPDVLPEIEAVEKIEVERRRWRKTDIRGYALVFAATDDAALNRAVADEARRAGVPVNVADDPGLCSFIVPACVRRGDLLIAVTTCAKSPTLSKWIRLDLEARYGPEYAEFVALMGELREEVKRRYADQPDREAAFDRLVNCGILELLRSGKRDQARKRALECI